jgi:outer membrane protein assembly factor BamB
MVVCAARESGQLYWTADLNAADLTKKSKKGPKRSRAVWSSPILASNRLITVSSGGEAVAINAKTGVVERRMKVGDDVLLGPIAAGGTIYVVSQQADLIAIR